MDKQRLALTALTLLPLAVACGTETGSSSVGANSTSRITGVHWTVDSLTVDGKDTQAPDSAYLKIEENGDVKGDYGCNSFGSTATVKGDSVDFGTAESTGMACEKAPMAFETSFARTLADGPLTADVDEDELTLTTKDGDRVHLTKEKDAPLYGTKWTVTSLVDGDTAHSLPAAADGKAWLTFEKATDKSSGKVAGSLGCNQFSAKATVRDGHLTLGTPRTTRKMCYGSLMDTENSLLKLFGGKATYDLDHRSITLTSENGTGLGAVADD